MLGLGRSPLGRRTPSASSLPRGQPHAEESIGASPPPQAMPASTNGVANGTPNGRSSESVHYDVDGSSTHSIEANGHSSLTRTNTQYSIVRRTAFYVREKVVRELSDVDDGFFGHMNIESFLEYITHERLTNMPHRGSRWDKVLKSAEFFAIQINMFSESAEKFIDSSKMAADVALGNCRLLLELGPDNAKALESSLGVFYKLGLSLSPLLRNRELFTAKSNIKNELAQAYADLLTLVGDVAVFYRKARSDLAAGAVKLDFYGIFGRQISAFHKRKAKVIDEMWSYKLDSSVDTEVRSVRTWLSPRDQVVQDISTDRLDSKSIRTEFTCEWSQRFLLDFFRNEGDILSITGQAGCGKSVLSGWIEERLQRPLSRQTYETISYTFESDIPSETTSLAFVKSLLLQLLDRNIGDVKVFKQLATAFERSNKSGGYPELENDLWEALATGVATVASNKANLVFLVDGLDDAAGGDQSATKIFDRLQTVTEKHRSVRSIVLSRHLTFSKQKGVRKLEIKADHVRDDIGRLVKATLERNEHYNNRSNEAKDKVVDRLLDTANGNFLWAVLVLEFVKVETTDKGFQHIIDHIPTTLEAALERLVNQLDFNKTETKSVFAWISAAERPLTLKEMKDLLEINVQKRTLTERQIDTQQELTALCKSAIDIRNGIVRFRHRAIREHVIKLASQNKLFMSLKAAHTDITIRLVTYIRICLKKSSEPSFDKVEYSVIDEVLRPYALLEYAVRHWTYHFSQSTMYNKDRLDIPPEFKAVFPGSSFFILVEWACWESQTTIRDTIHLHELSLRIRQAVFGEKHESVLQCYIVLPILHRTLSNTVEAGTYFYRASVCGQGVLRRYSSITITCTELFLKCTSTITFTTRTEIVKYREQMLRFIIEVSKHNHGKTCDLVLHYYKLLAELYIAIHEEENASRVNKERYEIIVIRFGRSSNEAKKMAEDLTIVITGGEQSKDIVGYTRSIFETCEETMDVWDVRRIQITLRLAYEYEASGDVFRAEEIFVTLWWRITEACRGKKGADIHITKIDIAIAYFRFLERIGRKEEAANILICIWTEYEHEHYGSETIIIRLKTIGHLLKTVGLFSIAITIFARVWGWFKRNGKTGHEEASSTTILISETLEEEIKTTTITTVSEETVREVFETTITRCKTTKKYSELLLACKTMVAYYIQLQKYSEAITVIHRSLEITWSIVLTQEGTIKLPGENTAELIIIIHRLAECHRKQGHFELAERFYLRIYRACLVSLRIDDELMINAAMVLIRFYEDYHRHRQAVEIYKELLVRYREQLGVKHKLTIRTLYLLGSLCLSYGWKEGYDYYLEIVTVLNKGSKTCHHDAIEAAVILIKWYYEEKRWVELRETCTILWETFIHDHSYKWTEEMVIIIYEKYRYVLEHHSKVEFSVLYKLTVQYKETSIKIFGTSAAIVIVALIELAKVCEMSEEHYHESVTIYEEILTKKTTITTTTITEVKRRLSRVYLTITRKSSSTSTGTIERAITVLIERFEALKLELGCWHQTTLTELREIVLLYKRLKTKESHSICIRMLQTTVVEIITREIISERLYYAAISIAKMYIDCELPEHGFEVLRQLRLQLILRDAKGCSFTLDPHVDRASYVFMVAFELTLRGGKDCTYSLLMTDLLNETFLYEHYRRVVKEQASVEIIITHGARLRGFLVARKRDNQLEGLDNDLYNFFVKHYGSSISTKQSVTFIFYLALLKEMGREHAHHHGIGHAACISSTEKVRLLIEEGRFQDAYDVATCAFQFIHAQGAYRYSHNIGYGWKLSLYLAGRKVHVKHENKLQAQMLELSGKIIREVLAACKEANINFVQVDLAELSDLVALLGNQKNYGELNWLLAQLWQSRVFQSKWKADPQLIINIGTYYVHSRFLIGDKTGAIRLCEDLVYNLRRALGFGPLHANTLRLAKLLSSLYTEAHRHRDAMAVHEEILRLELYGDDDGEDDGAARDGAEELALVREQLEWLRRTYGRLGEFDKSDQMYKDLYQELSKTYGGSAKLGVPPVEKWSAKGADAVGTYAAPAKWEIRVLEEQGAPQSPCEAKQKRKSLLTRARESWFGSQHHHHHRQSVMA